MYSVVFFLLFVYDKFTEFDKHLEQDVLCEYRILNRAVPKVKNGDLHRSQFLN